MKKTQAPTTQPPKADRKRGTRILTNTQPSVMSKPARLKYQLACAKSVVQEHIRQVVLPYGAGKTSIGLDVMAQRHAAMRTEDISFGQRCRGLVIAKPRTTVTWKAQVQRWTTGVVPIVIERPADVEEGFIANYLRSIGAAATSDYLLILSWLHVDRMQSAIMEAVDSWLTIPTAWLDETTMIQNPKALRTKAIHAITDHLRQKSALVCGVTGNMMPEGEHQIWSQLRAAYGAHSQLGSTYFAFLRKWFISTDRGPRLSLDRTAEFYQMISDLCFILDEEEHVEEYLSSGAVTPINYTIEYFEPTKMQKAMLHTLESAWEDPLTREPLIHTGAVVSRMRTILDGFLYRKLDTEAGKRGAKGLGETWECNDNPKLDATMSIITEMLEADGNRKIVLFHNFIHDAKLLSGRLDTLKVRHVVGADEEALIAFRDDPTVQVIVLSVAVAQGMDELSAADTMIFYSNAWSGEYRAQAEARLNRLGQEARVINCIDICTAGGLDEKVAVALQTKTFSQRLLSEHLIEMLAGDDPERRQAVASDPITV